jgi:hypothetical protein
MYSNQIYSIEYLDLNLLNVRNQFHYQQLKNNYKFQTVLNLHYLKL